MKNRIKLLLIAASLSLATALPAQETTPTEPDLTPTSIVKDFASHALNATNWTVAPYATYAPDAPTKLGGGVLAIYEVNKYIGAGIGVDWLGQFSMTSGNLQLKAPIQVGKLVFTPFAIGGLAVPFSGAGEDNGGPATIAGAGASLSVFKFAKGDVSVGYAGVHWGNAGAYDGLHHAAFLAWHLKF